MAEFRIYTNPEHEVIYPFSTAEVPVNISNTPGTRIELFYDRTGPKLNLIENGNSRTISLIVPKKPEDTGVLLMREETGNGVLAEIKATSQQLICLLEKIG
jgi:hypothetical protein